MRNLRLAEELVSIADINEGSLRIGPKIYDSTPHCWECGNIPVGSYRLFLPDLAEQLDDNGMVYASAIALTYNVEGSKTDFVMNGKYPVKVFDGMVNVFGVSYSEQDWMSWLPALARLALDINGTLPAKDEMTLTERLSIQLGLHPSTTARVHPTRAVLTGGEDGSVIITAVVSEEAELAKVYASRDYGSVQLPLFSAVVGLRSFDSDVSAIARELAKARYEVSVPEEFAFAISEFESSVSASAVADWDGDNVVVEVDSDYGDWSVSFGVDYSAGTVVASTSLLVEGRESRFEYSRISLIGTGLIDWVVDVLMSLPDFPVLDDDDSYDDPNTVGWIAL